MDQNDNNNFWDQPIPTGQPAQTTTQQTTQPVQDNPAPTAPATDSQPSQSSDEEIAEALKNMSNEEIIELFIEGLIIDKGFENLGEEEKDKIRDELTDKVEDFLTQSLVEVLPGDSVADLDDMIDAGSATPENVKKLLDSAGIDSGQVVVDALMKFRELYLNPRENNQTEA